MENIISEQIHSFYWNKRNHLLVVLQSSSSSGHPQESISVCRADELNCYLLLLFPLHALLQPNSTPPNLPFSFQYRSM